MRFFHLTGPFTLLLNFLIFFASGQSQVYLNGFVKSIEGETITYHAPDPRTETALLVRSRDSSRFIQWETSPVPPGFVPAQVSFVWMFGMDVSPDRQEFILSANGEDLVTFENPEIAEKNDIEIKGREGVRLRFRTTLIDRHKDIMGYAILTLPSKMIKPGNPVLLQIRGNSSESDIWVMTFQYPLEDRMGIRSQPVLMKKKDQNVQAVLLEIVNLDEEKEISVKARDHPVEKFILSPGYNALQYLLPEVKNKTEVSFSIKIGQANEKTITCTIEPVRPWTIFLVQHTHTDIGYTRSQSEILPEHLRFIDYALDFCDRTDEYPDDARFRWTCESAWAVDQYLKRRPENQVQRLLKRIEEGRIEVTAMPFNMSEIADETALSTMLKPIRYFHQKGIPVTTAMQDDVNGIGWCLADFLPDIGVNYLIMGEHGHRALIPFDIPTVFWWASPSGKKILAFRGEHYMYGNFLLLHTGDLENFRSSLMNYLGQLEEKGYPFNSISLQYSGYVTDNSPPAITPNEVIKAWNEKYTWPRLRSATACEFMKTIESNHGEKLDTIQKAWPDWWTDGFGSAARETAAVREAQSEMNITSGLLSIGTVLGSGINEMVHHRMDEIYDNILFYDEHTFGAAESISEPLAENSMQQWAEKSSYVWEALKQSRILREEAFGLIQDYLPRYDSPSIAVFNTLNWSRSGPVKVYIDHEMLDPGQPFLITDPEGNPVPAQVLSSRSDGTYWVMWVKDIPPLGYKMFRIKKENGFVVNHIKKSFTGDFDYKYWSGRIHTENGALSSLVYKKWNRELIDPESLWRPGQMIYEKLSDRHQLELFTLREEPERISLSDVKLNYQEEGPIWNTLSVSGKLKDCAIGPVRIEYRFYKEEPVIELIYSLIKKPVTEPEGLYVAFPFRMEEGDIVFEAQGGIVRPGKDQIPGTASDWNTVQHFVSIRSNNEQLVLNSPEIPLFHLGGLNLGNFSYYHQPQSNHFYSWVLNNYWTTNFKASQEGAFTWRYFIRLGEDPGNETATRLGWDSQVPLVGRVLTEGKKTGLPDIESIISIPMDNILLVNISPSRNGPGIVMHLREIGNKTCEIDPGSLITHRKNILCREVNAIGESLNLLNGNLIFEPGSVHFIELLWNQ